MNDRPCTQCIWRGVDGCTSWDCEPITRSEVRKWLKDGGDFNNAIPAADVVPVRRGCWKETPYIDYDDTFECSVCGEPWTLIYGTPQDNYMNYCPKCGAQMDGGADG